MASNEELQSTNEELQSVNEELYTVNSENQEKIEILNRLNADLDNMTRAALIPTLFLDESLKLTRFTPEARSIFRIRETDLGRPIDDFSHDLDYPELMIELKRVIDTAQLIEREVKTWNDQWYFVRILPYIDHPRGISSVVITFFEITYIKDAQRMQGVLDSLPEHIAVLDNQGVITSVNDAWRAFSERNGEHGMMHTGPGMNYLNVCKVDAKDGSIAEASVGLNKILSGELSHFSIKYPCHSPNEERWCRAR